MRELPWKHVYLHSTGPLKEAAGCESVAVGGHGVLFDDSGSTQPHPSPHPASSWSFRCLEDCGHGVCSGPPDFTCMCDLGWTSDLPPPTPAPGPPAPRCSRDCGCNFHSHCRRRGPGYCDECQGKPPCCVTASLGALPFSGP